MKILHLISSSGMYGAEAVILSLMHVLSDGPHASALGVFDNTGNPNHQLFDTALRYGLEAHLIPCAGQVDRSAIAAIRALAASTGADIVHAHGYKADIYSFLALRRSKIPLVSTCHTWYDTDPVVTVYGRLDRLVLRRFAGVVAVSEQVRRRLLDAGVRDSRIRIVGNGIDLRPIVSAPPSLRADLPPGALLIGLVGRLAWEKGVDIFLKAVAGVVAEFPAARFVVAGDGPDRASLEATRDALGLASAVTFLGHRDDMPSVYASLDLMVSASRQEGLPIALLEGMASGLPIVATAVGEIPRVVCNGVTGVIVPPENPAALTTAILGLIRDTDIRAQFSSAARELVAREYSADRMTADYLRVYQDAVAANGSGKNQVSSGGSKTPAPNCAQAGADSSFTNASSCRSSLPSVKNEAPGEEKPRQPIRRPRVFMMDLWATLPYYTAYLSRALLDQGTALKVGSITYYLDRSCYTSRGIRLHPGLLNLVGRFHLPRLPRRILKLLESVLNLVALSLQFLVRPPEIVHVQYLPMLTSPFPLDFWFIRLWQVRGSRIVLTVHDILPHDSGRTHEAAFRALYARVDALICHSASVRNRLVAEFAVPASKISIIRHGPFFYDLPASGTGEKLGKFGLPANKLMVLWQGIIFPYKGVDLLLEAWQRVEENTTEASLVIAGTGQPSIFEQIRAQAARLKLRHIHFHFEFISAEELTALYRAAALVTYPYRTITTSGALATGLALGKPIVATDLPVFRELLTDRENALLVPPPSAEAGCCAPTVDDRACIDGLASAILDLVRNPVLRDQFASRVRAMNFGDESWRSIACQTISTYQSALCQEDR